MTVLTLSLLVNALPHSLLSKNEARTGTAFGTLDDSESSDSSSRLISRGNNLSTLANNDNPLLPISHPVSESRPGPAPIPAANPIPKPQSKTSQLDSSQSKKASDHAVNSAPQGEGAATEDPNDSKSTAKGKEKGKEADSVSGDAAPTEDKNKGKENTAKAPADLLFKEGDKPAKNKVSPLKSGAKSPNAENSIPPLKGPTTPNTKPSIQNTKSPSTPPEKDGEKRKSKQRPNNFLSPNDDEHYRTSDYVPSGYSPKSKGHSASNSFSSAWDRHSTSNSVSTAKSPPIKPQLLPAADIIPSSSTATKSKAKESKGKGKAADYGTFDHVEAGPSTAEEGKKTKDKGTQTDPEPPKEPPGYGRWGHLEYNSDYDDSSSSGLSSLSDSESGDGGCFGQGCTVQK